VHRQQSVIAIVRPLRFGVDLIGPLCHVPLLVGQRAFFFRLCFFFFSFLSCPLAIQPPQNHRSDRGGSEMRTS
jgi:hypothetical protein